MFKTKEIKEMRFDVMYNGIEYMDMKNLTFNELVRFFNECEYMFGKKWQPLYLSNKIDDANLCHFINMFYLHNYIVCLRGEITRSFNRMFLEGESSLLKYAQESDYKQRQEKKRIKKG